MIILCLAEFAFPPYEPTYDLLSLILDGSWDAINENSLCSPLQRNATENGDEGRFPCSLHRCLETGSGTILRLRCRTVTGRHLLLCAVIFRCQCKKQRLYHVPVQIGEPADIVSELIVLVDSPIFPLIGIEEGIIRLGREDKASSWLSLFFVLGTFFLQYIQRNT